MGSTFVNRSPRAGCEPAATNEFGALLPHGVVTRNAIMTEQAMLQSLAVVDHG
jgi:hypothetical protein